MQPQLPPPPTADTIPLYIPTDTEQREIVAMATKFKLACLWHAKAKKTKMQKCYAYIKSEFFDSRDLLPRPDAEGSDRDNNPNRPQLFIPISREQLKLLFSYLKLTLFPTDEDYFRIRAKSDDPVPNMPPKSIQMVPGPINPMTGQPTPMPVPIPWTYPDFEDALTEGVKYKFKESKITYKLGLWLKDLIWAGNAEALPTFKQSTTWQWDVNMQTQQYEPSAAVQPPELDLDVWDPLHFYIDPKGKEKGREQWVYVTVEKLNEIAEGRYYFNKDKLAGLTSTQIYESQIIEGIYLNQFNDLTNIFLGDDQNLDIDRYYFPYLKLKSINPATNQPREFRNMLVTVAGGRVLIECRPNMSQRGLPPVVHWTWSEDKESPYGTGPIEDIQHLQRHINIISNYLIETLARIGNKVVVGENVDLTSAWGLTASVITAEHPDMVQWITGDYVEIKELLNYIGILKAEAQLLAGSQDPFQGSAQIDFKKTATEINVLQENMISVMREVVEHVSVGVEMILERFMYLLPQIYKEKIRIPVDGPHGRTYQDIDFSLLSSGQYVIELVGANPSQSKQAQVQAITTLIEGFIAQPQMMAVFRPWLIEALGMQGIKDGADKIDETLQNLEKMAANAPPPQPEPGKSPAQGQPQQPGVSPAQSSMAAIQAAGRGVQPLGGSH